MQPEATAASPSAVAGVGKRGVGKREELSAVAGFMAVKHLRGDGHGHHCVTFVHVDNVHPHCLRAGILFVHGAGVMPAL